MKTNKIEVIVIEGEGHIRDGGLQAGTACIAGPIPRALLAQSIALWKRSFGKEATAQGIAAARVDAFRRQLCRLVPDEFGTTVVSKWHAIRWCGWYSFYLQRPCAAPGGRKV